MKKPILFSLFYIIILFTGQSQTDTLFLTQPTYFTDFVGAIDRYAIASLTSSTFVVAYEKGGSYDGRLRVGTITEDSIISYGNETLFDYQMSLVHFEIEALNPDEFIIAYNDFYGLKIRKGKVNGDVAILYDPCTCLTGYCPAYSVSVNSDSTFIISYMDPQNSHGKSAVGVIDENQITVNEAFSFTPSSMHTYATIDSDTLSGSKFVVTYGYSGGYSVVGNINPANEIMFGELYEYNSQYDDTYLPKIKAIDENAFILGYIDAYGLWIGKMLLGSVTGLNQIDYGEKFDCSPQNTADLSITALDENKIVFAYHLYSANDLSYVNSANLSGSEIQINNAIINDSLSGANFVCRMDTSKFVVVYFNTDDFSGISKVGRTQNTQLVVLENFHAPEVSLFPNPASVVLNIHVNPADPLEEIHMIDASGRVVLQHTAFTNSSATLDIGHLKRGIYFVKAITKGQESMKKVVKI